MSAEYNALVQETRERLERAVVRLEEKWAAQRPYSPEHSRLAGKIEGVKLALSYLHEHTNADQP